MQKFKKLTYLIIGLFGYLIIGLFTANAQTSPLPDQPLTNQEQFVRAKVTEIKKEEMRQIGGYQTLVQTLTVNILEGPEKGKSVTITQGSNYRISTSQKVSVGEEVIVDVILQSNSSPRYIITDTYRIPQLVYIFAAFFIVTIFFTGKRGFGAMVGLLISLAVILGFILPQILRHSDPLFMCVLGSTIILVSTTYLAHGFSKQTTIAVISTLLALFATLLFAIISVSVAHLAGLGTEDSYLLEITPNAIINPKGLLLGGIIIGTLGALNDVTTTQTAATIALHKQNPKLKLLDLAEHAFGIGREHILSLVNTLVLAYAGSSLPVFIFFILNPSHLPAWVIINNESVGEEIIRTIAGSMGLLLAIPISTFLAAWWTTRRN